MKKEFNNIYFVKSGDTISSIALNFNIPPLKILLYNKILPQNISSGVVLYIKN